MSDLLPPSPLPCAFFLVIALGISGCFHALWLWSRFSLPLAIPIDGGRKLYKKRIFGENKTWRGLVMMPVASSAIFTLFSVLYEKLPEWLQNGLWQLPPSSYAILGFTCGLAFMLAELPNSFIKRRIGVAPGKAPKKFLPAISCFLLDRFDSTLGVLLVLQMQVPLLWQTWVYTLVIGSLVHFLFSYILYLLNIKSRPL